jgi:hypothetical protein
MPAERSSFPPMRALFPLVATLFALCCAHSPAAPVVEADTGWIARSDANAQILLKVLAHFEPERAGELGVPGVDTEVGDLAPGHFERQRQVWAEALAQLEERQKAEPPGPVAQDLSILVDSAQRRIRRIDLNLKYEVPYYNLPRRIFMGVKGLLDPQVAPERRPAALARIRKYAGLDGGRSWVELAEAETREGLAKPGLLPPAKLAVENDLDTARFLIDGVEKLFQKYDIPGREEPLLALRQQLTTYLDFIRQEVLPRARQDYRLPPELYAFDLLDVGVDIPAAELTAKAHAAFTDLQGQMQEVAARVAQARNLPSSDYRDVIRALKKEQIPGDQVLAHYQKRLAELEDIIRTQHLVTLPQRPARIRIGTPAENAQQPAPHMVPARFIGNTGEQGEFVLPLSVPGAKDLKYDDFNYNAASWTLTAHEARPGHELQFSRMIENGTSLARAVFAFNSVNVEGWGLYAEAISLPYMPDEGKLVSLQLRLQRAARAFVDPELQSGAYTPESATQLLERDVVLSPAFAKEEVDRFTFRMPAQATAYFYGYTRLLELRKAVEEVRGPQFDALAFHDQVLAQGVLPPNLMRQALLGR